MADLVQNYNFDNARHGNIYEAVIFNLPQEHCFDLTGAKIYMQLRKKPDQLVIAEFSTINQKLQILSNYSFCFVTQIIEVFSDTYYYDILIVFADGRRETYIGGKWAILPVITHKK
jgi:hypothetical protein